MGQKIKVLIVEDSPTSRKLMVQLLEQDAAIEVVGQAANGIKAVEMAEALRPDLITMDVVMPVMDGLEATRRIMARHPTPILIVTAHADAPQMDMVFEAMGAGALDVIGKPTGPGKAGKGLESALIAKVKALSRVRPKPLADSQKPSANASEAGRPPSA